MIGTEFIWLTVWAAVWMAGHHALVLNVFVSVGSFAAGVLATVVLERRVRK